jgi:hypothetical protein
VGGADAADRINALIFSAQSVFIQFSAWLTTPGTFR